MNGDCIKRCFTLIPMALLRRHLVHQLISFVRHAANCLGIVSNFYSLSHCLCKAKMNYTHNTSSVHADRSNNCRPMCAVQHTNRIMCTQLLQPNVEKLNAKIPLKNESNEKCSRRSTRIFLLTSKLASLWRTKRYEILHTMISKIFQNGSRN